MAVWQARLGMALADHLGEANLSAQSRVFLANGYRLLGRFARCEDLLAQASLFQASPEVEAKRFEVEASMKFTRGETEEARTLLVNALEIREGISDRKGLVDCLIQIALCAADLAEPAEALRLATRAARLCDPLDLKTQVAIHHNAAEFLLLLNQPEEAFRTIELLGPIYSQVEDLVSHPRRHHLAAKIARALTFLDMAEAEYLRAVAAYEARSLFHGWAVATVEMASLLASRGRSDRAAECLRQALPAFQRYGFDTPPPLGCLTSVERRLKMRS